MFNVWHGGHLQGSLFGKFLGQFQWIVPTWSIVIILILQVFIYNKFLENGSWITNSVGLVAASVLCWQQTQIAWCLKILFMESLSLQTNWRSGWWHFNSLTDRFSILKGFICRDLGDYMFRMIFGWQRFWSCMREIEIPYFN